MPQRHSKNAGGMNAEALTYAERKAAGYGTIQERLGKDAQGNWYDCNLTQAACVQPMCTPGGFLYSKQAILENLLQQKKESKRKLRAWEAEQQERAESRTAKRQEEEEAQKEAFYRANHEGSSASARAGAGEGRDRELPAYWLPSKTPEAERFAEKPSMACRCPASGKKLKLKDLFPLTFTRDPEDPKKFIDPLLKDELTNKDSLVALKPTGAVMKKKTYEALVKPDGVYDGVKVSPKDVLDLQKGGTGFAAHDRQAQSKKHFAVGMGSGMADNRGQNASVTSRFGLRFSN